ncbi:MAG: DUF2889 domain-containing protein [Bacillota bacterium]|nr:DUF2889 domain-containing protein [Bacillota bacterium]MDW7683111.1 DUF2889 domain-containing protein [Bacillota bacterium]
MQLFHRKIDITISDISKDLFLIQTTLCDMYHDILLSLKVSIPDFTIAEASVEMRRIPHENCRAVYPLLAALKGKELRQGFTRAVLSALGGASGCPNMVNLVLLSAPLAINAAAVRRQKQKNLTDEEMNSIWQDVLGGVCLAYPKNKKE